MTLRSTVRRTGSPISPPQNGTLVVELWWGGSWHLKVVDGLHNGRAVKDVINDAMHQGHTVEWVL